jgi:hypothetical protein
LWRGVIVLLAVAVAEPANRRIAATDAATSA